MSKYGILEYRGQTLSVPYFQVAQKPGHLGRMGKWMRARSPPLHLLGVCWVRGTVLSSFCCCVDRKPIEQKFLDTRRTSTLSGCILFCKSHLKPMSMKNLG